jgi:WD40 repeat protein
VPVHAMAASPDGSWLATAGNDDLVRVWDPVTGTRRHTLIGHTKPVWAMAGAPDGSWLATAGHDATVRVWDLTGRRPRMTQTLPGRAVSCPLVRLGPDGPWLATSDDDGTVRIWEPATGRQLHSTAKHAGTVQAAAPDWTWTVTIDPDTAHAEMVRVWDTATGTLRHTLPTPAESPWEAATTARLGIRPRVQVALAPDGSWLATGGRDDNVRIWDAHTAELRLTVPGHCGQVIDVAPDGAWLATFNFGWIRLWDTTTGEQWRSLTGPTGWGADDLRWGPVVAAVSADGSMLATAGNHRVQIWDLAVARHIPPPAYRFVSLAAPLDGSWLAATGLGSDGTVQIWDDATRPPRQFTTIRASRAMLTLTAPADRSCLAANEYSQAARILDPVSGDVLHSITGQLGHVRVIAPNASWLATSSQDQSTIRIWDPATGTCRHTVTRHPGEVTAGPGDVMVTAVMAAAPDGSWLAIAGLEGMINVWDPTTGALRRTLTGHTQRVWQMAVAPDGSRLATADIGDHPTVRVWDVASGELRHALTGHAGPVMAIAAAPDGTWLAVADAGRGSVVIWDVGTGAPRHTLTGHEGIIGAMPPPRTGPSSRSPRSRPRCAFGTPAAAPPWRRSAWTLT